jgi:TatD DNase family protein
LKLTDTHCHLDLRNFDDDRHEVLQRARAGGVSRFLVPALNIESSRSVVGLALSHADVFASIGLHPTEAGRWERGDVSQLRELATSNRQAGDVSDSGIRATKIVALGEIGLDYYWDGAPARAQHNVLREQLALAEDLGLPVIIHARERGDAEEGPCSADLLAILSDWTTGLKHRGAEMANRAGVWHSFSGSLAVAQAAIELGFYLGVTGPITYGNATSRRGVIAALPVERMLIETDSPYMAPAPQRGRRNEPAFVRHIADKIAEIHMTTAEKIAASTAFNASALFGWGG